MIGHRRPSCAAKRCPYKNRLDQCTAQFGCRNQRKPRNPGELRVCGGDDKIDYRSAWEPPEPARPAERVA